MTDLKIPKRPPDRILTIAAGQIHNAMTPWEVKVRSAHLLRSAGFKFAAYDGVKGEFRLKGPWLRTPDHKQDRVTFEQWDAEDEQ